MKKIVLIFLITLLISGCVNKPINNKTNENVINNNQDDKLIIDNYDLTLNENGSFDIISFKYPHAASISSLITRETITYYKKASLEPLFNILLGKMEHTSIEEAMKGFTKVGTKTINGIEWQLYVSGNNQNNYVIKKDYDVFVIGFIYNTDLSKFEEEFMNTVKIN